MVVGAMSHDRPGAHPGRGAASTGRALRRTALRGVARGAKLQCLMVRRGIHRRLVALAAAYALALHGLVVALAPPSAAPAFAAPLCSQQAAYGGGAGKRLPAHDPDCTVCPLACASAVPLPTVDVSLAPPMRIGGRLLAPWRAAPVVRPVVQAGLARGPPA